MQLKFSEVQLAQSASSLGAAILGFGVGSMWGNIFNTTIIISTMVIGAILHTAGMYILQLKNTGSRSGFIAKVLWITSWICLISIVIIFLILKS